MPDSPRGKKVKNWVQKPLSDPLLPLSELGVLSVQFSILFISFHHSRIDDEPNAKWITRVRTGNDQRGLRQPGLVVVRGGRRL